MFGDRIPYQPPEEYTFTPNTLYTVDFTFEDARLEELVQSEHFDNFQRHVYDNWGMCVSVIEADEDEPENETEINFMFDAQPGSMNTQAVYENTAKILDEWLCEMGIADIELVHADFEVRNNPEDIEDFGPITYEVRDHWRQLAVLSINRSLDLISAN